MRCLIWCTGHTKHNLRLCQHDRPSVTALLMPDRIGCGGLPGQHEWLYHQRDTEQIEVVDAAITQRGTSMQKLPLSAQPELSSIAAADVGGRGGLLSPLRG